MTLRDPQQLFEPYQYHENAHTASKYDWFERVELIRIYKFCFVLKKKKDLRHSILYFNMYTGERKEIIIHLLTYSCFNKCFLIMNHVSGIMANIGL